ncbi:hypothetical protein ACF09I_35600 [Streptomyces sp. NPDC014940]|uniref:hypothetical protein n=1 Tax=Streptomyces sp. NPDC014940 TaxID=3364932 RepID=UPI0036F8BAE8
MSNWSEERRRNQAAEAEQRRMDKDAAAERALKMRAAEDDRRRANRQADKAEARAEKQQARRDKRERRRERAQAWTKHTTPRALYSRGTVALVTASVLASLPAQVAHFASLSLMLVTVPFALEGAAWVAAFGVMYADEQRLPAWVRWLLRGMCLSAAGYAAWINYGYGMQTAPAVGYGLASVSLLGPLFFEVRQWVTTITVDPKERERKAEAKARAKHDKRRRSHHKDVVQLAERLVSAAPFGTLAREDAFTAAWQIFYGSETPGMTPAMHAQQLAARKGLADAMDAANGSTVSARGVLLQRLHPAPAALLSASENPQVESQMPPTGERPTKARPKALKQAGEDGRRSNGGTPPRRQPGRVKYHPLANTAAADTARQIAAVNGSH